MERKIISADGIPVYSYTNKDQHSFFISLFLRAGSMFEEENGVTHFFEHVAIRNINYRMSGELYAILDRFGLEFNAATAQDNVQFYITGAAEHFRLGADILVRVLDEIVLPRDEIDRERDRIRAEIREVDEAASLQGFTNARIHEGTSLARSITGTLGSVAKIRKRSLESFRRKTLVRENIFFYVTGRATDADLEHLASLIDAYPIPSGAPNLNLAPVPDAFGKRDAAVYIKNADFTKLRFSFDVDMSRVSLPVLDLLYDQLLGGYNSEFFLELSERRGLIYDLSGTVERYNNIGIFSFSYEIKEAKLAEALSVTVDILRRFKARTLPEHAVVRAGYVDNAMMLFDDARELNFTFAYDNHIMSCSYRDIPERKDVYASITPSEIRVAAEEVFTPDNLTLTMKGKKSRIDTARVRSLLLRLGEPSESSKD